MERLGVVVEKGGLVVEMGCGTGTNTRCVPQYNRARTQYIVNMVRRSPSTPLETIDFPLFCRIYYNAVVPLSS